MWIWERPEWPTFRWDAAALSGPLGSARLAQGKMLGAMRLFDPASSAEAAAEILVEDGFATSAIEGEHLDPARLRSSVARHLGLPAGGLPSPSPEGEGLIQVLLDATGRHDEPLTISRLCAWQAALFPGGRSGLARIRAGELRGESPMRVVSGRPERERIHFEAPPRAALASELSRFLDWFGQRDPGRDGLVRAGLAHLWFVTIHPFEDGNGRLARAITDMALSQDEGRPFRAFSLSAQILRERDAYYEILERTQRSDLEVTAWLGWFLAQVASAAEASEATIARVLGKARFWLKHQGTPLNDRQRKVLNRLLDAGPGGFAGGLNTRKYVGMTRISRATAYRELTDMVAKGCLRQAGAGRSVKYEAAW
ncbi:MAG: Fic family protein [Candidatus Sericytochromatia bacterium]|nr:Fic family protein [Candidatus Tanganyikabacteria bacterium]